MFVCRQRVPVPGIDYWPQCYDIAVDAPSIDSDIDFGNGILEFTGSDTIQGMTFVRYANDFGQVWAASERDLYRMSYSSTSGYKIASVNAGRSGQLRFSTAPTVVYSSNENNVFVFIGTLGTACRAFSLFRKE
jgi:hypothetical protein